MGEVQHNTHRAEVCVALSCYRAEQRYNAVLKISIETQIIK
jgi:hypothetical protein